ncbi:MAG: alpha/beta hydrolase [Rhizomicrobium sp.]
MIRKILIWAFCLFGFVSGVAKAAPALDVLGKDYVFPNKIDGLPAKLSDFKDLQINSFITSDGVKIAYWEAGKGKPLIFIPGWSANGAEYINVMYLLAKHYRVIVMDPRNQGLSQNVDYGYRIARFSMDLKELQDHLGISSAEYCGWSMGASVLWS